MERLTIKYEGLFVPKKTCTIDRFGEADDCEPCDSVCGSDCNNCVIQECFTRLGEYEGTGLTPEQLQQIDRLYAEKCWEVAKLQQRDTPVKVKPIGINHSIGRRVGVCPKCDVIVNDYEDRFCRECGRKLEWGSWEEWEEMNTNETKKAESGRTKENIQ